MKSMRGKILHLSIAAGFLSEHGQPTKKKKYMGTYISSRYLSEQLEENNPISSLTFRIYACQEKSDENRKRPLHVLLEEYD